MPIFSLSFSAAIAFFLRRNTNKIPASRAATPTRIPRARPAFAPPDMPALSPSEASDVGVAEMDAVADAVTDTRAPTSEPEFEAVGDFVATIRVD